MDKCTDCNKEESLNRLIQVKDKYPKSPKYKMVCGDCLKKNNYEEVGRFK